MKPSLSLCTLTISLAALCLPLAAHAQAKATAEEATAMVKKGVVALKAAGADKTKVYNEVTAKDPKWVDRDLYLVVYGLDGTVRAHGANAKQVGANLIDMLDIDGKPFVKERVELAKSKGTFWQDYKFTNPTTKKIEPKSMYCEKLDDMAVCAGIYK
ncbi:cache domain-containing protein [Rhodoferax saidenbachensis]|uniref:Signal transduction histidine kinase n=1 Tax=Rhodoferax saidenbachensis TaxID=1484693 RepID=A0ABU1ZT24_9BURK|nr:cache domain-containing protein [Rhodoferax saidenbachensis]MDR7308709.1 signal transduction histidine kinase [Rhodoferax saidenbachensis]